MTVDLYEDQPIDPTHINECLSDALTTYLLPELGELSYTIHDRCKLYISLELYPLRLRPALVIATIQALQNIYAEEKNHRSLYFRVSDYKGSLLAEGSVTVPPKKTGVWRLIEELRKRYDDTESGDDDAESGNDE